VRQLQNVVFRAITMSDQRVLGAADVDWAEGSISADEVNLDTAENWICRYLRLNGRCLNGFIHNILRAANWPPDWRLPIP
jgi:DNA-binding NtrC family response regulator